MKLLVFFGCLCAVSANEKATVYLFDPSGKSGVTGSVNFLKTPEGVSVTGKVEGLKQGLHGFHVHELGHIAPGCTGTGGHFNPHKKNHGAPEDEERHVGDLGNIEADYAGVAYVNITDKIIALDGKNGILGRAIVVHGDPDDLGKGNQSDSLTTGHAGARLACGVIGLQ